MILLQPYIKYRMQAGTEGCTVQVLVTHIDPDEVTLYKYPYTTPEIHKRSEVLPRIHQACIDDIEIHRALGDTANVDNWDRLLAGKLAKHTTTVHACQPCDLLVYFTGQVRHCFSNFYTFQGADELTLCCAMEQLGDVNGKMLYAIATDNQHRNYFEKHEHFQVYADVTDITHYTQT